MFNCFFFIRVDAYVSPLLHGILGKNSCKKRFGCKVQQRNGELGFERKEGEKEERVCVLRFIN